MLCNTNFIHYKIGFYDGHESMENGEKSYVDRRTVRRSTCVRECTVRLHLITPPTAELCPTHHHKKHLAY